MSGSVVVKRRGQPDLQVPVANPGPQTFQLSASTAAAIKAAHARRAAARRARANRTHGDSA